MALQPPYQITGQEKEQWHRKEAEEHFKYAIPWALTSGLGAIVNTKDKIGGVRVPHRLVSHASVTSGALSAGHVALAMRHSNKARREEKNRYGLSGAFDQARYSAGNFS